jgi:hypothetical protein
MSSASNTVAEELATHHPLHDGNNILFHEGYVPTNIT